MSTRETLPGVRIELSADRLAAWLVIEAHTQASEVSGVTVDAIIAARGLCGPMVRMGQVSLALENFRANPGRPARVEISRGVAPAPGTRPQFRPQFPGAPTPTPNTNGRIDPHARTAIALVRAGDVIGTVTPGTPGVEGTDVLGRPIAPPGPLELGVRLDRTVKLEPDGRVVAMNDGIPLFDGSTLRVSDRLHIKGSVDFSVGNVSFPNDIEIDGGVRHQFRVSAGRDLLVRDLVEAATVSAHRDACIERGVAAHGKGTLNVGRDLHIRYILNCRVIVGRDATVDATVNASKVTVFRHYRSPDGGFVGGHLAVSRTVVIGSLGAASGTHTEVVLGRVASISDKIVALAKAFPALTLRASRSAFKLRQLMGQPRLTAQQAEEMTELQFHATHDREAVARATAAMHKLESLAMKHTCVDLTVRNLIHPGVVLSVGAWRCEFADPVHGPLRITLDAHGEPLLTDLSSKNTTFLSTLARVVRDPDAIDVAALVRSVDTPHRTSAGGDGSEASAA